MNPILRNCLGRAFALACSLSFTVASLQAQTLSSPVAGARTPGQGRVNVKMYQSGSGFPEIWPGRWESGVFTAQEAAPRHPRAAR